MKPTTENRWMLFFLLLLNAIDVPNGKNITTVRRTRVTVQAELSACYMEDKNSNSSEIDEETAISDEVKNKLTMENKTKMTETTINKSETIENEETNHGPQRKYERL